MAEHESGQTWEHDGHRVASNRPLRVFASKWDGGHERCSRVRGVGWKGDQLFELRQQEEEVEGAFELQQEEVEEASEKQEEEEEAFEQHPGWEYSYW